MDRLFPTSFFRGLRCVFGVRIVSLLGLFSNGTCTTWAESSWRTWLSPELRVASQQEEALQHELAALPTPVVGQTVAEFGYQHPRLRAEPPTAPWIEIDLREAQPIDWIALVPAQVDWQAVEHKAHAFPQRFRVDVSDDPDFATFSPIAVHTDSDYPEPGIAPVALRATGQSARYVRLTVTKLAVENGQHFYALAELMVLSGQRNIAIGRPVRASGTVDLPPRWASANVVDGRTPLGPPIERELLPYDGLYAGPAPGGEMPWMAMDLGTALPLQEIRLHPIHARIGADIPGFSFPTRFRIDSSVEANFSRPTILFATGNADFPSPGNNAVTIPLRDVTARYVRITQLETAETMPPQLRRRFGLSEMEIFANGENVAREGHALAVPDPSTFSHSWPVAQLNDGYTSYGRLIPLPDWLASWQHRSRLMTQLAETTVRRTNLEQHVRGRVNALAGAIGVLLSAGLALGLIRQRRRRRVELEEFRARLARDLHDEIGSNLAGLAMLSETVAQASSDQAKEDWREVNRIARESTDAMREVLWVVGAREEAGIDLAAQLRRAAARVLPGQRVHWKEMLQSFPADWSVEAQRQVFLFFKEALANISRHAHATEVELSAALQHGRFTLCVADNGRGFDPASTERRGVGLNSLRERARVLHGSCTIQSAPGQGTRVTLEVPIEGSSR